MHSLVIIDVADVVSDVVEGIVITCLVTELISYYFNK